MANRVWLLYCELNGFSFKVLLRTTEEKLHDYIKTELPQCKSYVGAGEKEIEAAIVLKLPIYCY